TIRVQKLFLRFHQRQSAAIKSFFFSVFSVSLWLHFFSDSGYPPYHPCPKISVKICSVLPDGGEQRLKIGGQFRVELQPCARSGMAEGQRFGVERLPGQKFEQPGG